jgi:hypothetical protein
MKPARLFVWKSMLLMLMLMLMLMLSDQGNT